MIALIEDDVAMRQAVRRLLESEGFETEAFPSAEAFLASDAGARANCLVLDIRLPGLSGIDLYRQLRQQGILLPAIFMTAQDDANVRCAVVHLASQYLVKPFLGDVLMQAIQRALEPRNDTL